MQHPMLTLPAWLVTQQLQQESASSAAMMPIAYAPLDWANKTQEFITISQHILKSSHAMHAVEHRFHTVWAGVQPSRMVLDSTPSPRDEITCFCQHLSRWRCWPHMKSKDSFDVLEVTCATAQHIADCL